MKSISIDISYEVGGVVTPVFSLPLTEVTADNTHDLIAQANAGFDAVAGVPDDAIVTLVAFSGAETINYTATKADFLASEYNAVRLSRLSDGQPQGGISQEIADLIKQYVQQFVNS